MRNFNGTPEEIWTERKRLCKEHNISMIRAGCYLNNYEDDFLCGSCNSAEGCVKIKEIESKRSVEVTGEEIVMTSVTEVTDAGGSSEDIGEETGE